MGFKSDRSVCSDRAWVIITATKRSREIENCSVGWIQERSVLGRNGLGAIVLSPLSANPAWDDRFDVWIPGVLR